MWTQIRLLLSAKRLHITFQQMTFVVIGALRVSIMKAFFFFFCLFDSLCPINKLSVMQGPVFLG